MITNDEVKVWLYHPSTQMFYNWVKKNREEMYNSAAEAAFNRAADGNKSEYATQLFLMCKGIDAVIAQVEGCMCQDKAENAMMELAEKDRKPTDPNDDYIGGMIDYVYPREEANG